MVGQPVPALDAREKVPHLLPARHGSTAASFRRHKRSHEWGLRDSVSRPSAAAARARGQIQSPNLEGGFEKFVCGRRSAVGLGQIV